LNLYSPYLVSLLPCHRSAVAWNLVRSKGASLPPSPWPSL
jgi:hypothetical protein